MLIKKITLNNIRSYEHQEVEFPEGSVLLSGDIGSGKTSILLAVEFALFGLQPGQRGSSLLRNGENKGEVVIELEVEGRKIIIERTLKKGKTISQNYCSITIDGEKKELSVTELKDKVLEILNYPKEFSKKQNILYKFTVYTPQEEMKQIILEEAEIRMNTLRHVFGVDKYKRILENISSIAQKLREEKRMKEGLILNLEHDKLELISKEEELEAKQGNLLSVEKELFLKKESRKKIQDEKEEIAKKIEEKNKFNQEIEKTKIMAVSKEDLISSNAKAISQLEAQIKELKDLQFDESLISQLQEKINSKKNSRENLNEQLMIIISEINSITSKNEDSKRLEQKISNLDICPTCLQNVDAVYRANVLNKIHSETSENNKKLKELAEKQKEFVSLKLNLESELSESEKKLQELNILKIKLQDITEKEKRLMEITKSNELLKKDIELLLRHMESLKGSVFELGKFDRLFELKKEQLEEALSQERITDIKTAELRKEIELFTKQIDELKYKIKKTKEIQKQMNFLNELEQWLSKEFTSIISFVEKNVMLRLKSEFSRLFSEWFSVLVSESLATHLNEEFTPIIEQRDYEIDYAYLSGGERTAIALAYRLALNQVINSLMSRINTKDLVILDEPTDGFSEQQLDKMRDVLQQMNVRQLIIVSHEQKIEGFVENVIRFKKEKGVSRREV